MKSIWKYKLERIDEQKIKMPAGAKIISVGVQNEEIYLWAIVNVVEKPELRSIGIVGTGRNCWCSNWTFIGSVMDGPFVWHIFEKENENDN